MKAYEQERLSVLKMLEDGKITPDEAVKLLDALKPDYPRYEPFTEEMEEKLSKFSNAVDCFAKDFGQKVESVYKDMEPKLKKATRVVVEKTATIIDDISKSLNESLKNLEDDTDCNCDKKEDDCCCNDNENENKQDNEPKEN